MRRSRRARGARARRGLADSLARQEHYRGALGYRLIEGTCLLKLYEIVSG